MKLVTTISSATQKSDTLKCKIPPARSVFDLTQRVARLKNKRRDVLGSLVADRLVVKETGQTINF